MEPFISFKATTSRFCQTRSMRLAMDWKRFRKLPLYFRWRKFSDPLAVYKLETTLQSQEIRPPPNLPKLLPAIALAAPSSMPMVAVNHVTIPVVMPKIIPVPLPIPVFLPETPVISTIFASNAEDEEAMLASMQKEDDVVDEPTSKRRKLADVDPFDAQRPSLSTALKESPVRKQRSFSMSAIPEVAPPVSTVAVIPILASRQVSALDIPGSLAVNTHMQMKLKSMQDSKSSARERSISPPMAPPECSLNGVAHWHNSIRKRRMSCPSLPLSIPVDPTHINLDNVSYVLDQLHVFEERMARRSLHYWNDFGFGIEYPIEPTPVDPYDIRHLYQLREWSRITYGGSDVPDTTEAVVKVNRPPVMRRERSNSLSSRRSARRRNDLFEALDELSDEDGNEQHNASVDVETNSYANRYNPTLESDSITARKEQELELYLMRYGPTAFLDENGRDITDSNDHVSTALIQKMISVQESQIAALQYRYGDLINSFVKASQMLKAAIRDARSHSKLPCIPENGCGDINKKQQMMDSAVPSLVSSKLFGSEMSLADAGASNDSLSQARADNRDGLMKSGMESDMSHNAIFNNAKS